MVVHSICHLPLGEFLQSLANSLSSYRLVRLSTMLLDWMLTWPPPLAQ